MPPTGTVAQGANHARQTNHDGNATLNSTYKHIWDQTMAPINLRFDQVGFEDIQNDKAMMLLLTFVNQCKARIPFQKSEKTPYIVVFSLIQNTQKQGDFNLIPISAPSHPYSGKKS
jgi:hypothetical protein